MSRYRGTPEGAVLRAILDFCAAKRVLAFRMNTGAMKWGADNKRMFRFGTPGMADVLAFPRGRVLWIEAKAERGVQSELQKAFEAQVRVEGHEYVIARSIDDVDRILKVLG